MVLVTIAVLAIVSTIDSKTIVTGSTASQHALSVSQSDTRAQRLLRSNFDVTENIDGDDEERIEPTLWQHLVDSGNREKLLKVAGHMNPPSNQVMYENAKLEAFLNDADHMEPEDHETLLMNFVSHNPDVDVQSLTANKKLTKEMELAGFYSLMKEEKHVEALQLLVKSMGFQELLKSRSLTFWMSQYRSRTGEEPFKLLYNTLKAAVGDDKVLAESLATAKLASEVASKLEEVEFANWQKIGLSHVDVFTGLGIRNDDNPLLRNIYVSYVESLELNQKPATLKIIGDEKKSPTDSTATSKTAMSTTQIAGNDQAKMKRAFDNEDNAAPAIKRKQQDRAESVGDNLRRF